MKNIIRRKQLITRRQFIQTGTMATAGLLLAACASNPPAEEPTPAEVVAQNQPVNTPLPPTALPQPTAPAESQPAPATAPVETPTLAPTPQCDDHDETPAQTEGPFYTPNTPQRTSFLEEGVTGTTLIVTGRVLTPACQPLAGAVIDFWHADDGGQYDNVGYRLRGHQFTAADGSYRLETILPGLYPGRTRHIHVKVQGLETSLLTTQLYFPNEPDNQRDGIFRPELLMEVTETPAGQTATFDFVLT